MNRYTLYTVTIKLPEDISDADEQALWDIIDRHGGGSSTSTEYALCVTLDVPLDEDELNEILDEIQTLEIDGLKYYLE